MDLEEALETQLTIYKFTGKKKSSHLFTSYHAARGRGGCLEQNSGLVSG